MSIELLLTATVGLFPVLLFLISLQYLDSYKLVNIKVILTVITVGGAVAACCYWLNGAVIEYLDWDVKRYSRYAAPIVEEAMKALVVIYLFRSHRIGFLVDAAILGFAVGAGFAVIENFYFLYLAPDAHIAIWVVRGFGTAIMHGASMAIFAVLAQLLTERNIKINPILYLPGFVVAVLIHSTFNHFPGTPILTTAGTLLVLPTILFLVFQQSARAMHDWLEVDFDEDAMLLEQLNSGKFTESKLGEFLDDLKQSFPGTVVVDMLCYYRLYTELALRAKGRLMAREAGLDTPIDETTKEKFTEMRFLEKSIGKTGCLAMSPFLAMTRKDLWQLFILDS
ncbi:MAG: RsiW-degrading membrane proteinase PrsW (M82 family) [Cryomorphaceae bacterium]|jgi:RsiW-degrading membrane proteinase PrsW (M82 family)